MSKVERLIAESCSADVWHPVPRNEFYDSLKALGVRGIGRKKTYAPRYGESDVNVVFMDYKGKAVLKIWKGKFYERKLEE